MNEPSSQEWRTVYAAAISELGSTELGLRIEEAEVAIQERLREAVENFSASEESELYAALRKLRHLRAHLVTAA